ncbi:hypothetical protein SKAU_G00287720 [Synaphobranchus kaupii]|uniref:C2H2-type domain-containing protein n=1 Tax=Synaphobranchus kaupii TaxID=118154 RepID=A0A9Q1EYC1_SYNKA|nr:hypothetical protein SKAU_G00287720 [Synaphobranchus kaupii]
MSKLDILNAYLTERLMVAVREILVAVGETVSEFKEESDRTRRENECLRQRLRSEGVGASGPWSGQYRSVLGATHTHTLVAAEGSCPVEQQHSEQEWSSGLREELAVNEEERLDCENQRSRLKNEELGGQQFDHTTCSKAEYVQLYFHASACDSSGSVFKTRSVKPDGDRDSVQPSVNLKTQAIGNAERDSLSPPTSHRIKEEPEAMKYATELPTESFEFLNPVGTRTQSSNGVGIMSRQPASETAVQQPEGTLRVLKGKSSHFCPQCGKAFSHASGLKMTKLQILNAYLTERLMVAVREILEVVGDTVSEYQEETARIHRENESLRRKLREVVIEAETGWTGTGHPLSLPPTLSPGAAHPLSLSAAEGSSPLEQQHSEQEWSSGLREELVANEEDQELCERQRSRQKEEEFGGMDLSCVTETETEPEPQPECITPGLKKLALEIALSVVSPSSLSVSHELSAIHMADDAAPRIQSISAAELGSPVHLRPAQVKTEPDEGPDFKSEQPADLGLAAKSKPDTLEPLFEATVSKSSEMSGARVGHVEGPEPQEAGTRMDDIQNDSYFIGYRGEKQHRCFQCGKFFSQVCNLKTHLQIHTGERPYTCTWCGKSFTQSADLRRHQRIHTGEKPHRCTWCEKSFTQIGNLKRHLRIHTGERPYCCTLCGKSFNDGDTLKKHRRIHTGERPFRCVHCSKTFTVASSLQNHLRNHLKEGKQ